MLPIPMSPVTRQRPRRRRDGPPPRRRRRGLRGPRGRSWPARRRCSPCRHGPSRRRRPGAAVELGGNADVDHGHAAPVWRASTLMAAPPARKLATIWAVTSCGHGVTPRPARRGRRRTPPRLPARAPVVGAPAMAASRMPIALDSAERAGRLRQAGVVLRPPRGRAPSSSAPTAQREASRTCSGVTGMRTSRSGCVQCAGRSARRASDLPCAHLLAPARRRGRGGRRRAPRSRHRRPPRRCAWRRTVAAASAASSRDRRRRTQPSPGRRSPTPAAGVAPNRGWPDWSRR